MDNQASSNERTPELSAPNLAPWPSRQARLKSTLVKGALHAALPNGVLFTRGRALPGRNCVALSFDDGPDAMTERCLTVCDELGVRATFFVIGAQAERDPGLIRAIASRGHELAGHGYTHRPFPTLSRAELDDELRRTADRIPPSRTPRPLVRPPRGHVTPRSLFDVAAAGFATALWSIDSDDCRSTDPAIVAARMTPGAVRSGAIVLLHEGQAWTLEALRIAVPRLREAHFELVTVGEILGA